MLLFSQIKNSSHAEPKCYLSMLDIVSSPLFSQSPWITDPGALGFLIQKIRCFKIDEYCAWTMTDGAFIFIAGSGIIKSIKDTACSGLNILPINAFSLLLLPFWYPPDLQLLRIWGVSIFFDWYRTKGERCHFYANSWSFTTKRVLCMNRIRSFIPFLVAFWYDLVKIRTADAAEILHYQSMLVIVFLLSSFPKPLGHRPRGLGFWSNRAICGSRIDRSVLCIYSRSLFIQNLDNIS